MPKPVEKPVSTAGDQGLVGLIRQVMPAVVRIETDNHKLGSGVIVDNQGQVLTNNHVGRGPDKISLLPSDGTRVNVTERVANSPEHD